MSSQAEAVARSVHLTWTSKLEAWQAIMIRNSKFKRQPVATRINSM